MSLKYFLTLSLVVWKNSLTNIKKGDLSPVKLSHTPVVYITIILAQYIFTSDQNKAMLSNKRQEKLSKIENLQ